MFNPITISIGKLVQAIAGLRGGGSALPGLVVEKLDPHFAPDVLYELPMGVVLVSGTNGKTTTVKIVTELLEAAGLRVFTNNTGSNFMRGVVSSLLRKVSLSGRLNADIAVLELDEAHAVSFVKAIKPRYALLLNVMRDQLDRFGEIDYTAQLLTEVARSTTNSIVLNREDPRLADIARHEQLLASVHWFGLAPDLKSEFPDDDSFYDEALAEADAEQTTPKAPSDELIRVMSATDQNEKASPCQAETSPTGDGSIQEVRANLSTADDENSASTVLLTGFQQNTAHFLLDGKPYETSLALKGIYNAFNAAAALALVHSIVPDTPIKTLTTALSQVHSAFGRGESVMVDGQPLELILVKNPGGFKLALKSFDATGWETMIVMNDDYGDGRDVSWYFDVGFTSLKASGVAMVSGTRAYDMALRLEYDEVPLAAVECDVSTALDTFLAHASDKPRRIYCSYTMMMAVRRLLAQKTEMEKVQ